MRILLVKSPKIRSKYVPLGLGYIGAVLERAGHTVKIIDMAIEKMSLEKLKTCILTFKPEVIGLTGIIVEFV